tara:strand:+ start:9859 stop:11856 length:1998 start_codon:yes stop_codon:yes gene_type:complete
MKSHWIMDYETLSNFFCGVFKHYKKEEYKVFVIHSKRDDRKAFIEFLEKNKKNREYHISFNGLGFDAQITHWFLDKKQAVLNADIEDLVRHIYDEAQATIQRSNNKEFSKYPEWKMTIPQIDVYKLNHWDNMAKRSSLKWIEYTMDWNNILDMPIDHESEITTDEEIDMVIDYCINDVNATQEIYNRSKELIGLRINLSKEYNINLFNASEPRISKELFAFYLSKELDIPKYELKKMRTFRRVIKLEDIILPYVTFKTPEFQLLLDRFKTVELNPLNIKGAFKYSVKYKGVKTDFGLGGVHGANKPGIYEPKNGEIIMSSDVTSFYPNLAIKNSWSPAHLPKSQFCELYEWFFTERKKIPKSNPMNYVYKIILNSTYGLSNDKNSFLYDPEFTMRITINGQLTLMMLYEMIMEAIPEARAIMQNTDGIETIIPESAKEEYFKVCEQWEKLTQLNLEHDEYQRLIFGDVNNYIGIFKFVETDLSTWRTIKQKNPHYLFKVEKDKFYYAPVKCKGRFEFTDLALHKNKSKLVIPKGIYEYFVNNKLPEDYLKENTNILDYCIGSKTNSGWQVKAEYVENGIAKSDDQQKINRYYVSNSGSKLVKVNKNDGRVIQLEAGPWMTTMFNKMILSQKFADYDINYKYYQQAIEKEVNNILGFTSNQLNLFD